MCLRHTVALSPVGCWVVVTLVTCGSWLQRPAAPTEATSPNSLHTSMHFCPKPFKSSSDSWSCVTSGLQRGRWHFSSLLSRQNITFSHHQVLTIPDFPCPSTKRVQPPPPTPSKKQNKKPHTQQQNSRARSVRLAADSSLLYPAPTSADCRHTAAAAAAAAATTTEVGAWLARGYERKREEEDAAASMSRAHVTVRQPRAAIQAVGQTDRSTWL